MASYKLKKISGTGSRSTGAPFQVLHPQNKARLSGLETIYGLGIPGGFLSFLIDGRVQRTGVVSPSGTWCLILNGPLRTGYHTVRITHHSYIGLQTLILRFIIVHKKGSKAPMYGYEQSFYGNCSNFGGMTPPNCSPLIPPAQDPNGCSNQPYCPPCISGGSSQPSWPTPGDDSNYPPFYCPPPPPPVNWPPLIPPAQDDNGCSTQPYCPPCPQNPPIYYPPFPDVPGDFLPPSSPPPFFPPPQPPKPEKPAKPEPPAPPPPPPPPCPAPPPQGVCPPPFFPYPCPPFFPPWAIKPEEDEDEDEYEEEPVVIKKKRKKKAQQPTRTIIKKVRKPHPGKGAQQPAYPAYPPYPVCPPYYAQYPTNYCPPFYGANQGVCEQNTTSQPSWTNHAQCGYGSENVNAATGTSYASGSSYGTYPYGGSYGIPNANGMITSINGMNFIDC